MNLFTNQLLFSKIPNQLFMQITKNFENNKVNKKHYNYNFEVKSTTWHLIKVSWYFYFAVQYSYNEFLM